MWTSKTLRFSAALVLASCSEAPRETRYECMLVKSCGEDAHVSIEPACGHAAAASLAREWSDACTALTLYEVREGLCPFVVCAVWCPAEDARTDACDVD